MSDATDLALAVFSGLVGGGVNAIAGGGTIITFGLLEAVLPAGPGRLMAANVTSTIGLWPGSAAAAWASRGGREGRPAWARWLLVPSVLGALVGVGLLRWLPHEAFDFVVPWLILMAGVLFAAQPQVARLARWLGAGSGEPAAAAASVGSLAPRLAAVCGLQFAVGIYGGYFGAGIGILMLAVLPLLGQGDIRVVNAVKNLLAAAINGVATAVMAGASLAGGFEVSWPHAAAIAAGSIAGGVAVARLAVRLPPTAVRRAIASIAFALAGYHLWKEWTG